MKKKSNSFKANELKKIQLYWDFQFIQREKLNKYLYSILTTFCSKHFCVQCKEMKKIITDSRKILYNFEWTCKITLNIGFQMNLKNNKNVLTNIDSF